MIDFLQVAEGLHRIASEGSTLNKQSMLQTAEHYCPGIKEVLRFIYDPNFTTGIGKKKLDTYTFWRPGLPVEEVMAYLRKNSTGTLADIDVAYDFIYDNEDPIWQWAATGLVTKDLQIGVSLTMLNKVFGKSFIPKIGIMRGTLCPENIKGLYLATEKIDGNRRLIMTKETGIEIYTRSGKRDYGLLEIEEQARKLPTGYVFDTECIAVGEWADSIECRQASASILNRTRGTKIGIRALCFDIIPQEEYDNGVSKDGALARKVKLAAMMGDTNSIEFLKGWFKGFGEGLLARAVEVYAGWFEPVKLSLITALPILGVAINKAEGIEIAKPIWQTGGEGVMLVEYMSAYEVNPNPRKTLLKIKATKEFKLYCTDYYEGENKYQGMLGAIEVVYVRPGDPTAYYVKVGSGFPDYLRKEYWEHPEKIVGKIVEIESFGESRNAQGSYSLNCPIFKRIAGEKE